MEYSIKASSISKKQAVVNIKKSKINFGISQESDETLANPAELFLSSFSACILKSVERFSRFLNFEYSKAEITVSATRAEKPPRIDNINYELIVYSQDNKLNIPLLKKNIEKFGTIFNTVQSSCTINGKVIKAMN